MSDDPRQVLTLAEAAARLQVSVKTIRRYIAAGRLVGYRIGPTLLRVDASSVETLLKQVPTVARPAAPTATAKRTAAMRTAVQYVMEIKQPGALRFDKVSPRRSSYWDILTADHIWPPNMIVLTPEENRGLDRA